MGLRRYYVRAGLWRAYFLVFSSGSPKSGRPSVNIFCEKMTDGRWNGNRDRVMAGEGFFPPAMTRQLDFSFQSHLSPGEVETWSWSSNNNSKVTSRPWAASGLDF